MTLSYQTQFYIKATLLVGALGITIGQNWHELAGSWMIPLSIALGIVGYWFGKITCAEHDHPGRGIAATLGLFVILNGTHSLIDGISLAASGSSWFSVIAHEIVRQLALYGVILGMLAPFPLRKSIRYVTAFFAVTVVWVIVMGFGEHAAGWLVDVVWLHPYLAAGSFLLVGDIVHHLIDEYRQVHKKTAM